MKKLFYALVAALVIAACSSEKTYTIEGSFDIPEILEFGDTAIERGPIEGYVYILDLNGEVLDSALIENEKFTFTGLVDADKPYFAYLVNDYAAGMFVVEPGTMQAVISMQVSVTGTEMNTQITEMMDRVAGLESDLRDEVTAVEMSSADALTPDTIMAIYGKYSDLVTVIVDSVYMANTDNLIGVFCINAITAQAGSEAELEEMIAPYSDYVKNSELIKRHFEYLKELEANGGYDYFDEGGEGNPGD
ncbi:MAG: DUF4369 domain-containing protein [Bacteroidales bacterium]|nr:DUF4369 domain-containing protein [Candidatus Liminaster caballi]